MNSPFSSALPLLLVGLLAACGDDTSPGNGGGGGDDAATTSTSTTSGTTQPASTTTSTGGDGQGGEPPFSCEDDAMICARGIERAESCGLPAWEQDACVAYQACQRRLLRDDLECDLFTCGAEATCDGDCSGVILDREPTEAGQAFLDRCLVVMPPCKGDDTEPFCAFYGHAVADDIATDMLPCLDEEAACSDISACLDEVIVSTPECPDL